MKIEHNDSNLILRDEPTNWGGGVYLYNGFPFTGIICYRFSDNTLAGESEYKNGILDGRQVEYWQNGKLKEECFQKYDYYIRSFKRWDDNGILISHQEFDQNGNWIKTLI